MDIVLIHGFSSLRGEERLKLLIEEIKKELPKAKIIVPNYLERYGRFAKIRAGRKKIADYAGLCWATIEKETSGEPLILIGYSMGGLIARVLVEKVGIQAKAVILVGTPNRGIKLSRWEKLLLKIVRRPLIEDAKEHSKFLRELNENYKKLSIKTKYYLIAGWQDKRVPPSSVHAIEAKKHITLLGVDHSGLIPRKYIWGAIHPIIEILKKEAEIETASFLFTKF